MAEVKRRPVSILWRRLDEPGHESARVVDLGSVIRLSGSAVFVQERRACQYHYRVECDKDWRTRELAVSGWHGHSSLKAHVIVGENQHWYLNGKHVPEVTGCIDIDFNFSPSTNLLPIQRLSLKAGEKKDARAAWLRLPELTLEPLDQYYERLDHTTYRYGSPNYSVDLKVNPLTGFVREYENRWIAESLD